MLYFVVCAWLFWISESVNTGFPVSKSCLPCHFLPGEDFLLAGGWLGPGQWTVTRTFTATAYYVNTLLWVLLLRLLSLFRLVSKDKKPQISQTYIKGGTRVTSRELISARAEGGPTDNHILWWAITSNFPQRFVGGRWGSYRSGNDDPDRAS